MNNQQSLNAWLKVYGYTWNGEEQMYKGLLTHAEAEVMIQQLLANGALKV